MLYYENEIFFKIVLASMLTFLLSEFMAIYPIISKNFERYEKNVLKHIVPVWEITGTFIVFFVVELELIYSSLVPISSYLLIPLVGIFVAFLILRNAWIIYAEFLWKDGKSINKRNLYRFYSIATFIMVAVFLIAVSALIYGKGINLDSSNLSGSYINFVPLFSTFYFYLFFAGTLILMYGFSMVFYRTSEKRYMPLLFNIAGIIISAYGLYGLTFNDKLLSIDYLLIPVIIGIIIPVLYIFDKTTYLASYKPFFFVLMIIGIFFLEYPVNYIAAGAFPVKIFESPAPMLGFNIILSIAGGIGVTLLMIAYSFVYNNGSLKIKDVN
ncbi:hypothetical protein [Picrophilus oshimae]|uniref:Cytochrome d ubiquinol oxidase subunit II n=1 Tax=Picrophilus torridus (strain ATCC 700027 / DSM 9790 / JCM 10055 / NBRC 100828 / KAW 2/3) TaxID=1122961 RepID=Q6L0Q2_PICTO|nr:hypothetical protein [Picrophilus oshimae]AAT43450.1 hypothetical membrane protein [Picrophilus oshimae DSM 9789]SMD30241.1 cytochrome d ubiquinol oxidase subunit II [Picrophilus oshimae DSM 9789]